MYAVYEYLESLGVRWYSPDYTVIPKKKDVALPDKSVTYKPQFWYRDQWWDNGTTPEWLARMRVNGSNAQDHTLPDSMGGSISAKYGCHSFMYLIPENPYFTQHPEWFALRADGTRSTWEYCLTNPGLREFTTQKVLDDLRKCGGKVDNFWVSQNDGSLSGCLCPNCTAEREAHGGKDRWSANIIGFVNYVAENIASEFPKVHIKTLAYSYTVDPPENMTAHDNVLVEICGNFAPGDSPYNTQVRAWGKVAKNISVYTYGGSNFGYWWPYPNVYEVGMQYPWARECGVTAFFVQGTALGKGSGLVDMKAYISARMAWDPSRDVNKEIRDFCDGFYGPGGKYVVEYLDWYRSYMAEHKLGLLGGWGDAELWRKWVTKDAMVHCDGLFAKALAAVKDNPAYLNHVRRAYLEVLWGSIMIDLTPGASLMDKDLSLVPGADAGEVARKAKLFGEIMRENGYNIWSEPVPYDPQAYPH